MPPSEQLTKRQRAVYEFIRDKIQNRGYGPTVREIGERFRISSPNGVMCHLKALEKKGLIRREPNMSRAIQLATRDWPGDHEEPASERGLPLAGRVAAGVLHEAIEQQERIDFGAMFAHRSLFVLEVSGDSMIEAQIADGDFVVVKKQKVAAPGQMVVARTEDGEATLKYWFPEKNRIRLQPANSAMKPIFVPNAEVLGIVVGVVRQLNG
jgi:repressor LexA